MVAYSADGLSLIGTQVRKRIMLDAFTSSMCEDPWGWINFVHALMEINGDSILKHEVNCKIFGHSFDKCPKRVSVTTLDGQGDGATENNIDGFMGITKRGAEVDTTNQVGANALNKVYPSTSNSFDALNTMDIGDDSGASSSRGNQEEEQEVGLKMSYGNEYCESDDEVDEFLFLEGDKFGDTFGIRLKGRVSK
ncbi:hypothetical protein Tco_1179635 [Tanacetum coccineum]